MEMKHLGALLFVSKEPLTLEEIANLLEVDEKLANVWMEELQENLQDIGIIRKGNQTSVDQ